MGPLRRGKYFAGQIEIRQRSRHHHRPASPMVSTGRAFQSPHDLFELVFSIAVRENHVSLSFESGTTNAARSRQSPAAFLDFDEP